MKTTFDLYRNKTEIILTDEAETDNEDLRKSDVEGPQTWKDKLVDRLPEFWGYTKSFYNAS